MRFTEIQAWNKKALAYDSGTATPRHMATSPTLNADLTDLFDTTDNI